MCPDTCQELVTTLDSACAGKSFTDLNDVERVYYEQAFLVAAIQLLLDGACADADLIPGEPTCTEAYLDFTVDTVFGDSCEEVDGMCPSTCEDLFTALDIACAGGQSYTVEGESAKYNRGDAVEVFSYLIEGACIDAISGATILGTHASATLIMGSIAVISSYLFL